MPKPDGTCHVKHCRRPETSIFYKHGVCDYHWLRHCDDNNRFDLKVEFGVRDEEPVREDSNGTT